MTPRLASRAGGWDAPAVRFAVNAVVRGLCFAVLAVSVMQSPVVARLLRADASDVDAEAGYGAAGVRPVSALAAVGEHRSCAERVQARYNCTLPGCADLLDDTGCYINYIMLHQCTLESVQWLGWIVLVCWQLFLMYMMGNTADGFFCPALDIIVDALKISPNLAGVTFLSFGNGANDVFGSFSAFLSDQSGLAISSILGGGIFITTVVVAAVALSSDVRLNRRPFLRDVGFYILAVLYLMLNFGHGTVYLVNALGFVLIYVAFATVVVVGRRLYQGRKRARLRAQECAVSLPTVVRPDGDVLSSTMHGTSDDEEEEAAIAGRDPFILQTANYFTATVSSTLLRNYSRAAGITADPTRAPEPADPSSEPAAAPEAVNNASQPARVRDTRRLTRKRSVTDGALRLHQQPLLEHDGNARTGSVDAPTAAPVEDASAEGSDAAGVQQARPGIGALGRNLMGSVAQGLRAAPFQNRVRRAHHRMTAMQLGEAAAREDALVVALERVRAARGRGRARSIAGYAAPQAPQFITPLRAKSSDTASTRSGVESESEDEGAGEGAGEGVGAGAGAGTVRRRRGVVRQSTVALQAEVAALLHEEERAREEAAQEAAQGMVGRFVSGPLATAVSVIAYPAWLARRLSVPILTEEDYDWRITAVTPILGIPFVTSVALETVDTKALMLEPVIPGMPWLSWLLLSSVAGAALSALCFLRLPRDAPPSGLAQKVLMMFAFFGSVSWIIVIANEIVAVLVTLGTLLRISTAVLGLSVMAWGNSLGDLVADVAVARSGEPKMAVAACYAGPLFNMLIGMGLALTVGSLRRGSIPMGADSGAASIWVCFAFLLASLCSAIIVVPLDGFRVRRWFGYSLLGLYVTFLITSFIVHFS